MAGREAGDERCRPLIRPAKRLPLATDPCGQINYSVPLDNNDAQYLRGVSRTTVQFECYWDVSVSTHTKFENDVITATETEIRFVLSYPPAPTVRTYEGKCVVTGYEITARNGDLIRANITVQMATGMTVT